MDRFQASRRSDSERETAAALTRFVHTYDRVGYDWREMAFLPDGTIGLGAAGREVLWDVREEDGEHVLNISSETEPTCRLRQNEEGIWRGAWLHCERMPVEVSSAGRGIESALHLQEPGVQNVLDLGGQFAYLEKVHPFRSYADPRARASEAGLETLLDNRRLHQLTTLLLYSLPLGGDTIECGVYKGGLSAIMGDLIQGSGKTHYLCDSFVGLPEHSEQDGHHRAGDFADTSLGTIRNGLSMLGLDGCTRVMAGWFHDTLPALADRRFCFAHVDADYYESTLDCLEFLYPRMIPGGWMVLDDFTWHMCEGAKKAIDTFFADKPEAVIELSGHAAAVQRLS